MTDSQSKDGVPTSGPSDAGAWSGNAHGLTALLIERDALVAQVNTLLDRIEELSRELAEANRLVAFWKQSSVEWKAGYDRANEALGALRLAKSEEGTDGEPIELPNPIWLAKFLHDTYERLAPQYGYETRPETRTFDHESPNGRLMAAVCEELRKTLGAAPAASGSGEGRGKRRGDDNVSPMSTLLRTWAHNEGGKHPDHVNRGPNLYLIDLLLDAADEHDAAIARGNGFGPAASAPTAAPPSEEFQGGTVSLPWKRKVIATATQLESASAPTPPTDTAKERP